VTAASLVTALAAAVPRFSPSDRVEKIRLLDRLAHTSIRAPGVLRQLHETLCFLQAYPDDADVLRRADEGLVGFPARVDRLGPAARRLDDSGIAGTFLEYPFGLPMARWLARASPSSADIMWANLAAETEIEETMSLLVLPIEGEALSDEGGLGWRRWLRLAKGNRAASDLALLVELFDQAPLPPDVRERLFDALGLSIGWRPDGPRSRTLARLPWPHPFFHGTARAALVRPDRRRFRSEIMRPLASLQPAPAPLAHALIDAARAAMATRLRELFAFSHANADDVLVADPGRGLRIALIGIVPRERLPLHGYYAYLVLKNGVPVSYGAGWQIFGVLEAAVNVFESFRRGESAFIVYQVLRAYHQALGMRRIVIDPYQIGLDNPEALASGAFYFYRHLGFVSLDPGVERLARAEDNAIRARPDYRSPRAVLRQLASSGIGLSLGGQAVEPGSVLTASRLGAVITRHVAQRFGGDRAAAVRRATRQVVSALGVRGWARWGADERRGFAQLAPVIALIPDLARWPAADRRRLAAAMRAKGGASEASYVRRLDGIPRLRSSLEMLAGHAGEPVGGGASPAKLTARQRRESTAAR
jgi:hypothetical protein